MASPRWSASTLLASMILLYWTTSSAWSHSSTDHLALYRIKRGLPSGTKEKTEKSLQILTSALSVLKDVAENPQLKGMMQNLATFASLAPGVGTLIAVVINTVLVFIPQEDPVLKKLEQGFAEVNRKLDSLSTQISDLATDVEWNSYASIYSQDETCILNAWKKFLELERKVGFKNFKTVAKEDKDYRKHYKCTKTSVEKLYHYLTVKDVSLTKNLNELLKSKFKCDLNEIYKYNFFLSSLLWKGLVLKEVYWKLTDSTSDKEAEHAQMLKNVYKHQQEVVDYCLDNSEKYAKDDVEQIAKKYSPDKKDDIAKNVKTFLDKKYSWYNWVVVVYDQKQEKASKLRKQNMFIYNMNKLNIGEIVVAVTYTLKADEKKKTDDVTEFVEKCFKKTPKCHFECSLHPGDWSRGSDTMYLTNFAKVTVAADHKAEFAEFPPPLNRIDCTASRHKYKVSVHVSRKVPVNERNVCKNKGKFKRLMNSNEWLCICQNGYYGDTCDKKMNTEMPQKIIHPSLPKKPK